jgi:hypothetical protein
MDRWYRNSLDVKDDPMRTHQCLTLFLCGVFLLGGTKAYAQNPGAGFANFSSHAQVNPAGVPPGFNPYPAISPFEHAMSSTYNERGIWLNETSNEMQSRGYFRLDSIVARFKGPSDAPIGHGNVVNPYFDGGDFAIDNNDAGRSGSTGTSAYSDYNNGKGPFANSNTGLIDSSHGIGMRILLGTERSDGIGFEFSGLMIGDQEESTSSGYAIQRFGSRDDLFPSVILESNGIINDTDRYPNFPTGPDDLFGLDVVDVDNITVENSGIGLDDGSILGTIQRFDLYKTSTMRSRLSGGQITLIQTPSRQVGPFTVRPMFGVRYLNPKERFSFEGHDSGLDYDVLPFGDPDRASVLVGGVESTVTVRTPYRAYINSETDTHLGGAEMGWRYAAGGEHFKLTGETKLGVMGAREKSKLKTKGLGQAYLFNQDDEPGGNFNVFYDEQLETATEEESNFITPVFEQSFNTSSNLLSYIPVVKDVGLFREAKFTAGWTFLFLGQLQRPNEQIVYQSGNGAVPPGVILNPINGEPILTPEGDPTLEPDIKKDRSIYFVNYFNLGVEWKY